MKTPTPSHLSHFLFERNAGAGRLLALGIIFFLLLAGTAAARSKKKAAAPDSHNFFAFADAHYYTSPDQRIGAKLLIDPARVGPTLATLQHLTYLPGAHVKSHRHVYVTEVLYVLKGNLTLRIGSDVKVMGPDTAAYIPPQTFHEYLNEGSDVCQFLQYFSPGGPEEEYRNWVRPEDAAAKAAKAASETAAVKEKNIVRGPLPPIPGSPHPRLQRVDEETLARPAGGSSSVTLVAPAPVVPDDQAPIPVASGPGSLELKTRFEKIEPALKKP